MTKDDGRILRRRWKRMGVNEKNRKSQKEKKMTRGSQKQRRLPKRISKKQRTKKREKRLNIELFKH